MSRINKKVSFLDLEQFTQQAPQCPDLEESVLGIVLLEPDKIYVLSERIKNPKAFYVDAHERIYIAMLNLHNQGKSIDFMTVCAELRRNGELDLVGGSYYVTSLTRDVVGSAHLEEWIDYILERYQLRELIKLGFEVSRDAYATDADPQKIVIEINRRLNTGLNSIEQGYNPKTVYEAEIEALNASKIKSQAGGGIAGYSTGIKSLDEATGGIVPSDLTCIAAGTSEGKTTLARQIAEHIAVNHVPTVVYCYEMSTIQLGYKGLSDKMNRTAKDLRFGRVETAEIDYQLKIAESRKNIPLYYVNAGGMELNELTSNIKLMKAKYGVGAVFVDYLGLIPPSDKHGTREQEVSTASRALRQLALKEDIAMVELSQLSRGEKTNLNRMYMLSDLRDSGSVEQDATTVIFIWMPVNIKLGRKVTELEVNGKQYTMLDERTSFFCVMKNRLDKPQIIEIENQLQFNRFVDVHQPLPKLENIF